MNYFQLNVLGLKRKLPIVKVGKNLGVASFNLLGDTELVEVFSKKIADKLKNVQFDFLVGPEVKVVPILHEVSRILKKERYVVCRKNIHAYMVNPVVTNFSQKLVMDGRDAEFIKNKKAVILDDVISSGRTVAEISKLLTDGQAEVVKVITLFKQKGLKTFLM